MSTNQEPNIRDLMQLFRSENGVAKMMQEPVYPKVGEEEPSVSQAEVVADLFNTARLDVKLIAEAAGVDLSISRMTPEGAAMLIQGLIRRQSFELIDRFNELEWMRQEVIFALHSEERLADHIETKQRIAYSQHDPDHEDAADPAVEAAEVRETAAEKTGGEADAE